MGFGVVSTELGLDCLATAVFGEIPHVESDDKHAASNRSASSSFNGIPGRGKAEGGPAALPDLEACEK